MAYVVLWFVSGGERAEWFRNRVDACACRSLYRLCDAMLVEIQVDSLYGDPYAVPLEEIE